MTKPNTCTKNKKGIIPTYYLLACPRFSIFICVHKVTKNIRIHKIKIEKNCPQNANKIHSPKSP
jgi:hypothetical protein